MIHKRSLTEAIAEYAIDTQSSVDTAVDAIAEQFVEAILESDDTLDLTYEEMDVMSEAITETLESFSEDAKKLVDEWNEDAREMEAERREALRGQY
jgi:gas vesicle protein